MPVVAPLLIAIIDLRKPEIDPWSNLQKLRHATPNNSLAEHEEPVTLKSLFKTDFPNIFKLTQSCDNLVFRDGERVSLTCQGYADFQAKTSFVGFYIPSTTKTFASAAAVADDGAAASQVVHCERVTQSVDRPLRRFEAEVAAKNLEIAKQVSPTQLSPMASSKQQLGGM